MKKVATLIVFINVLLISKTFCLGISNEVNDIHFSQLSTRDGLSRSTIISITQDHNSIMWFATFDGLNRYDGYAIKVYRNESENEHSLMHDVLRSLYVDKDGILWVGSQVGISEYIYEKDHFNNYPCVTNEDESVQVHAIIDFTDDELLLGTEAGLLVFDKKTKEFRDFPQLLAIKSAIHSLAKINQNILIGSVDGLYIYNHNQKFLTKAHDVFDGVTIQAILPQSESKIWIGTEGEGLFLYNLNTREFINYRHNPSDKYSISSNYIRSLTFDSQLHLWIGTFNALSIKTESNEHFTNYFHDPMKEGSLSHHSIRSIYMDTQGGMWLGSFYGGVNYYHPLKNKFDHLQQNPYLQTLNDRIISCMLEDEDGRIWIGTNDKGINIYDPKNGSFEYINKENTPTFASNNVKAFLFSKDNKHLYIGTHGGGLLKLNKQTKKVERIVDEKNKMANVYALTYGKNGDVAVGSLAGLFVYSEADGAIREYDLSVMTTPIVFDLKLDSKGRLWIGGDKSIGVYNYHTQEFKVFKSNEYNGSLINSAVNFIFEDSKKRIWIGTQGGLNLYKENGSFQLYNKESGLPGNMTVGMLEDSYGRLWISTNEGLSCFNPERTSFKNYSEVDGLLFRQFNSYSYCQSQSGLMYFGGINGITYFYPELLIDNPYAPAPGISKIIVQNREVLPFDDTGILQSNILETKEIRLKPEQSSFTIEFFVTNYLAGKHNQFAFRLDGVDKTWNYTTENRQVSYRNLKHGKYVFKVKAANNDGKWNESPKELVIRVLPHWWETWWAIILYLLATAVAVWFVWRFVTQRRVMDEQLRMERLEKEKIEEVNQMKTSFFINISHEFKTPLTLILSPLQEIIEKTTDKWQLSQLSYIQKNTNKLLHLVNQLMDYRRAELGVFELKASRVKPQAQIVEIFNLFEKLAKRKKISFYVHDMTSGKEVLIDVNYLELILNNLLSNAFKFTPEGGKITVRLDEDINYFILEVEDNGQGIPESKLALIFDRFYQANGDSVGSGIGLSLVKRLVDFHHAKIQVESQVGKGSRFTVHFPQNEELYDTAELLPEGEEITIKPIRKTPEFLLDEAIIDDISSNDDTITDTLLIVEDNAEVSEYLVERLSKQYHILTAQHGLEALEILKDNEVDIILSDVMMPEMDGIKLCKTLKQNIKTCHIPIIMLSAKSNIEDQLEGLEVGADDYVPKPFTFSVLKAKIQNMLKSRRRTFDHYSKSLEIEPEKITFNAMDEELLKKAMQIVMDNLDNSEFSTDQFCSAMNMSRSNLHIKLKAITGESTIDFIRKIRFNEACKLLLDGRYNVAEVSTMVGFNTPSYFATSFKKYFGVLPTEYVKNRRS